MSARTASESLDGTGVRPAVACGASAFFKRSKWRSVVLRLAAPLTASALACGCTGLSEYVHNGFKVGPNYGRPPAPVAKDWIDADDVRVRKESDDLSKWWTVFNDPVLDSLVCDAYGQSLTLREAGFRVLEARAQYNIAVGNLFPQTQTATGSYTNNAVSQETANSPSQLSAAGGGRRFFPQYNYQFNLAWELDFWGRFRRAIEANAASLDASVEDYDNVLVTLLGDVATNYSQLRTTEERLKVARQNIELQQQTLTIVEGRFRAGTIDELDVDQARSTLEQTQAQIPELEISLRQTTNQLCILLGVPVQNLQARLGAGRIPTAAPEVAVGIPADLLRRRPDVRRAERQAAAQCAQIGIAEADFYPRLSIGGELGYTAARFSDLFKEGAFQGNFGPSFNWSILNYGRIANNVRLQDARFQEAVAVYQDAVLSADRDVENGLIVFLRAQQRTKLQAASVRDAERAVKIALAQYAAGTTDLTRVTQLEQNLVQLQDTLALAQGEIANGLIQVYRALGGGWQLRINGCPPSSVANPASSGESPPSAAPSSKAAPEPAKPQTPPSRPTNPPSTKSPPSEKRSARLETPAEAPSSSGWRARTQYGPMWTDELQFQSVK